MDLGTLRCFVAVAEEEHVGRAALRLNISASPLSRQIRKLEAELGVALFERQRQRLSLTEAGQRFLAEARDLLAHAEAVKARGRGLAKDAAGSLCLGVVPSALYNAAVVGALKLLRRARPGMALRLVPGRSPGLTDQLRRGLLDMAFVYRPPSEVGLDSRLLARRPLHLIVAADHPLAADRGAVAASALAGEAMVALDRAVSPGFRDQLVAACRRAGFEPDIRFETSDLITGLAVVRAGLACGVLQDDLPVPDGIVRRPLAGLELFTELHAVWRPSNPAATVGELLAVIFNQ
ncbi:MAG: LysR family transcriptional regulator [Bacteroidales bacterium]